MFRLSLAVLRLCARLVPRRDRDEWLAEWESELGARRARLLGRQQLTPRQEVDMFRRVLGSFRDAAWLRRQFTFDADIVHDLRHGARLLLRSPAFTLLTTAVLAVGIGATTGIYSVVDALLVRQLPYREPERIVLVFETDSANPAAIEDVSPGNFVEWRQQAQSFEVMSAAEPFGFTLTEVAEPHTIPALRVSEGFFDAFGVEALHGRTFAPDEYTRGRNNVVVLSYGTWAQQFGSDPAIVGRAVRLNGQPMTVVGIMPPSFAPRLLVTFSERGVYAPKVFSEAELQTRGTRSYSVLGKLKPGVSIARAQAELGAVAERLAQQYPNTNGGRTVDVVPLRDHLAGDLRQSLGVLSASVALLLVIAIANAANLLLTRSTARTKEIGVRGALGADRGRLVRQLLAETLLLASVSSAAGLLLAEGTARLIVWLAPGDVPALSAIGVNSRVLLFSTAVTVVVAVLAGITPAWRVARVRAVDALANAATGHGGALPSRTGRSRFVIAQLALAMVLLAGGGLLLRSFGALISTSPGFAAESVAALQIFYRVPGRTPEQTAAFFQQIIDSMRTVPQVREVGAVSALPFLDTTGGSVAPIVLEDRPIPPPGSEPAAFVTAATPEYFSAMRIPLLEGRRFEGYDDGSRPPVVLISHAFATRHWPNESPVGQRVRLQVRGELATAEIIGVVGDVRHDALDGPAAMEVFLPQAQAAFTGLTFVVRTAGDAEATLAALRARIYAVAPNQPVYRTAVMQDLVSSSLSARRFMLTLVLAFAILAVGLAATGVYGVMSLVSAQRTREFGLRLALGAARGQILRMVMRQGAVLTAIGMAVGLAGALAVGQVLRRFLFGIGPNDLVTLAAVCGALGAVAALACLLPAIRATRVSPVVALRAD
ncbi:MAG: ABC transporter permease [Vicinamibacterales bacterium]